MSRKGGYKIIDLKGLDFSSNMVIDGIHESIEDNYGKPLLFSGIVIDGVEKDDVFANAVVNGDGYDVMIYNYLLHINDNDVVMPINTNSRTLLDIEDLTSDTELELKNNDLYAIQLGEEETYNYTFKLKKCDGVMTSSTADFDTYSYFIDTTYELMFSFIKSNALFVIKVLNNIVYITKNEEI